MQIEFLNVHRGEHLVNFDTDTPEGRAKFAEEFQRLMRCGTAVFLERAGKDGTDTLRITGYDPATDKIIIQEPIVASAPPSRFDSDPEDDIMLEVDQRKAAEEDREHVAPCPKVDGDGDECTCPKELKGKIAKVGDSVYVKLPGQRRRSRFRVKKVDPATGHIVAVAPVSGGSCEFSTHDNPEECVKTNKCIGCAKQVGFGAGKAAGREEALRDLASAFKKVLPEKALNTLLGYLDPLREFLEELRK